MLFLAAVCVQVDTHTGVGTSWCIQVHLVNSEINTPNSHESCEKLENLNFLFLFSVVEMHRPTSVITLLFFHKNYFKELNAKIITITYQVILNMQKFWPVKICLADGF